MSEPIRGITLWEPYATLIARGYKTLETRAWSTSYRGSLLIHASKRWDREIEADVLRAARAVAKHDLPLGSAQEAAALLPWVGMLGCIVARCRLVGCDRVPAWGWTPENDDVLEWDFEFGDLSPGRYAWSLDDVVPVLPPVPWKGAQGLWPAPSELVAEVNGRIGATEEGKLQ